MLNIRADAILPTLNLRFSNLVLLLTDFSSNLFFKPFLATFASHSIEVYIYLAGGIYCELDILLYVLYFLFFYKFLSESIKQDFYCVDVFLSLNALS